MNADSSATRRARAVRLLIAACLATASTAFATFAMAEPVSMCHSGGLSQQADGWTKIRPPAFVAGGSTVSTVAPALATTDRLYATNGTEVDVSNDGGCSWNADFTVPTIPSTDRPFSAATAQVHQVVTTSSNRVYLLVEDAGRVHVMVSDNGGSAWRLSDTGLAHANPSQHARLVPSPSPGTLYLLAHLASDLQAVTTTGADVIYVTTNDGQSWTPMTPTVGLVTSSQTAPAINDMAVDPRSPQDLWAATSTGLAHSADGGTSWTSAGIGGDDALAAVDVAHDAGSTARVLAYEQGRPVDYLSTDGGSSWVTSSTPATVDSSTWGYGGSDTAIAAGGAVYQLASEDPATWFPIWHGQPDVGIVAANHLRPADLYACECGKTGGSIWRHAGLAPPPAPYGSKSKSSHEHSDASSTAQCMPKGPSAPNSRDWGTPQLDPSQSQLMLAAGQSKTVSYTFVQPPRELDVFFTDDSGPRSEFSGCPFKVGVVAALNAVVRERNIRAGLADFGDYPGNTDFPAVDAPFYSSNASDYPYELDRIIGGVDQNLYNRVARQPISGEAGPAGDQSDLAALYQAATGAGQIVGVPAAPTFRLEGGLQASFSPTAYKVILHVAGKFFNDPDRTSGYPGPKWAVVSKALRSLGIHQEGIWVNNRLNKQDGTGFDYKDGHVDLNDMAKQTGAISPKTIDCNGDGVNDVVQGGPLVCVYIAPAEGDGFSHDPTMGMEMRRLIEALIDPQPISLKPVVGASAVARITPPAYRGVDDLLGHVLHYDVTYRCGPHEIGQSHPVTLDAMVGSEVWATSNTQLTCGMPIAPAVPHVAALPLPPPPVGPNPIPNPGPNPGVNPAPNPAPNPAQAPQAQPQPIAHLAAVPATQEQPQLALQDAGRDLQANEPMSALTAPSDPFAWAHRVDTWGGMALFALGAALARRVQVARAVARKPTRARRI
jgi:hypothetical protein